MGPGLRRDLEYCEISTCSAECSAERSAPVLIAPCLRGELTPGETGRDRRPLTNSLPRRNGRLPLN